MSRGRSADVARFREAVARTLGLHFSDDKQRFLAELLERRAAAARLDASSYLDRLSGQAGALEISALVPELTVPETYFFRHAAQFRALAERALPDRLRARRGEERLRLLSAGCASGEEAYSLAMVERDVVPRSWDVVVRGIDVNPAMIDKAERGHYSEWSLRETPPLIERRWFTRRGRALEIDGSLRASVRFDVRNLIGADDELWAPASYDIIFLRNVLMYFEPPHARAVLARVERALLPGGYLFLGCAETLRGLSSGFALRHTHDAFYYQRHDSQADYLSPAWDETPEPARAPAARESGTWIEAVQRARTSIAHLTSRTAVGAPVTPPTTEVAAPPATRAPSPAAALRRARDLLRDERYAAAAAVIDGLPAESAADPGVLLLIAAVETHRGRLREAEAACHRLLGIDAFNAGAHYLLALCRDAEGEPARAAHHDQVAIYLDPVFAMPHVHLGLLARRRGETAAARRTLEHAMTLLQREDEGRLLLFGGGFGRDSLVALCRTEIDRLGRPA